MSRALGAAVLVVAAVLTLMPFVTMVAVSLAPAGGLWSGGLMPAPSLAAARRNYAFALTEVPLPRCMANWVLVCACALVLQVLVAAPAGYAPAKLPVRGRPILFAAVILALMIPMQVPAIPLYVALAHAGLPNTYAALILPFVISAFAIFLFRQSFASYPDETRHRAARGLLEAHHRLAADAARGLARRRGPRPPSRPSPRSASSPGGTTSTSPSSSSPAATP